MTQSLKCALRGNCVTHSVKKNAQSESYFARVMNKLASNIT